MVVGGDSRDKAIELVHKMENSDRFRQTYIERENAQSGQSAGDAVQFEINAQYVPQAPTDNKPTSASDNKRSGE